MALVELDCSYNVQLWTKVCSMPGPCWWAIGNAADRCSIDDTLVMPLVIGEAAGAQVGGEQLDKGE